MNTPSARKSPEYYADKALQGQLLTRREAQEVLDWPVEEVMSLLQATFKVRKKHFGKKVKLNFLANIQSGVCPEDCNYCSQSKISKAPIDKYRLMDTPQVMALAERARRSKASRLCLVASGRGPSHEDVDAVSETVRQVKEKYPDLEICCCMGLLKDGQAENLKEAGVDAYNHNLNTSEGHYGKICSTHTYEDRVSTLDKVRSQGISSCSGVLLGMGENSEDIISVAFRLREMEVESIPVNFLVPIKGTPLSQENNLTPLECLKVLCLFRLINPTAGLRVAGGREIQLKTLQPLALYVANSIFVGDYLTTEGQAPSLDYQMIEDLGFEVLGDHAPLPQEHPSEKVTLLSKK